MSLTPRPDEDLADYVRRMLKERGLRYADVEERSGGRISSGYVGHIVRRITINPSPDKLRALAAGLGIPDTYLFKFVMNVRSGTSEEGFRGSDMFLLYEEAQRVDLEERRHIDKTVRILLDWLTQQRAALPNKDEKRG